MQELAQTQLHPVEFQELVVELEVLVAASLEDLLHGVDLLVDLAQQHATNVVEPTILHVIARHKL